MALATAFLFNVLFISIGNCDDRVKVVSIKPYIYSKIEQVVDTVEGKRAAKAVAGVGGGIAGGAAIGFAVGGPLGAIAGAILGANAGAAAGAVAAGTTQDKISYKSVKTRGYIVVFNNGQKILTQKKYKKGQKVGLDEIVYDKMF